MKKSLQIVTTLLCVLMLMTCISGFQITASAATAGTSKSIADCAITLKTKSYTYDGRAKRPDFTIKDGKYTLMGGKDYIFTYENNIAPGTAKIVFTGKGNYSGRAIKTFTINKREISNCSLLMEKTNYTYNGRRINPKFSVKDGDSTLAPGKDYIYYIYDNTNCGFGRISIIGKGIYHGELERVFEIKRRDISLCTVTLSETSYDYKGKPLKPKVTVKDGNTTLKNGTDYTIEYINNDKAGKAIVKVTGKGNFSGTAEAKFDIYCDITDKLMVEIAASKCKGADGKYHLCKSEPDHISVKYNYAPTSTIDKNGITLKKGIDYIVEYTYDADLNNGTATIKGKGHYKGTFVRRFAITTFRFGYDNWNFDHTGEYFDDQFNQERILEEWKAQLNNPDYTSSKRELSSNPRWCYDSTIQAFEEQYNYDAALKKEMRNRIYNGRVEEALGSCSGITAVNILLQQKDEKIINIFEQLTGKKFTSINSIKHNDNVISIINYVYIAIGKEPTDPLNEKRIVDVQAKKDTHYDAISVIEDLLKNQDRSVKLSIKTEQYTEDDSHHAVMAYGIEDCNYTSPITGMLYDKRILILDHNSGKGRKCVEPNDCIYYNSKTHSYIMPYRTKLNSDGSFKKSLFWNNDPKAPNNATTLANGGIKNVCTLGSLTDELFPD